MKFKINRMNGKPIDPEHTKAYSDEFRQGFDELVKDGKPTTDEGWTKLNVDLKDLEKQLIEKYPTELNLEFVTPDSFVEFLDKHGPYSLYKDESDMPSIAILGE